MPHTPRWPLLTAPRAPRHDHLIQQLGRQRNDPYAWLRHNAPASGPDAPAGGRSLHTLPAPLRQHLQAEMAYADAVLQPLAADAAQLRQRLAERAPEVHALQPASSTGWRYGVTRTPGHPHRVFTRSAPDGREQTLFDEAERAAGHAYYRAADHQHSPDDRWLAWAEDVVGDDRHRICLLDMAPAIDHMEELLINYDMLHGMHPVLTMCAANAVVIKNPAGDRKLDKSKATGRIDGMVAMAMALGAMGKQAEETKKPNDVLGFLDSLGRT